MQNYAPNPPTYLQYKLMIIYNYLLKFISPYQKNKKNTSTSSYF